MISSTTLWKLIEPRIPRFFYFAEYSKLPYSVKVDKVVGKGADVSESEATAGALLRLGGAEQDYILNPDYERRKRELENVSNALTEDVLKYWTQNPELRVVPEITQRTETDQQGRHTVLDELKIRIWDGRHSLSLPFDQHSAGFQWFFSFLAAFSEYEHQDPPVIILLDEPAVGLHAKAQADFLRFIEERLYQALPSRVHDAFSLHDPAGQVGTGQVSRRSRRGSGQHSCRSDVLAVTRTRSSRYRAPSATILCNIYSSPNTTSSSKGRRITRT